MTEPDAKPFPISPKQSQILSDAQRAIISLIDLVDCTRKVLETLDTEVINPELADPEIREAMNPTDDALISPPRVTEIAWGDIESELQYIENELESIARGSGDAIVVVNSTSEDRNALSSSIEATKESDEKAVIEGLLKSFGERTNDKENAFPVRSVPMTEIRVDEFPILGLSIPGDHDVDAWRLHLDDAKSAPWPVLIPYVADEENRDEKTAALWTVDGGRFMKLQKTKLMKRAWAGSRLEFRAYACLLRAMRLGMKVAESIDSYKLLIDDRAGHCAALERKNKSTLRQKQQTEKTHSNQRKNAAKRLLTELKRAAKELAKLDFGEDFNEFDQKPKSIISARRVEERKAGRLKTWLDTDKKEGALTEAQMERLNNGGGHDLNDDFEKAINETFETRLKAHTDSIATAFSALVADNNIRFLPNLSGSESCVKPVALGFDNIRKKHEKQLAESLNTLRLDKGPKDWRTRAGMSLLQTVSKVKSIPLMLVGLLTVLSPFLVWSYNRGKSKAEQIQDVKTLLDKLTTGLYDDWRVYAFMVASFLAIGFFLWIAHRQNTNAYYKDVKKGRDTAQKLYVKQMKAAVTEAYAHYLQYLGESLSAWKRSPEALQDYLDENVRNPRETELEELKRKSAVLSGWKKELGARKKDCDELSKRWKAAIKSAQTPANQCGVFQ